MKLLFLYKHTLALRFSCDLERPACLPHAYINAIKRSRVRFYNLNI